MTVGCFEVDDLGITDLLLSGNRGLKIRDDPKQVRTVNTFGFADVSEGISGRGINIGRCVICSRSIADITEVYMMCVGYTNVCKQMESTKSEVTFILSYFCVY